jgi:hypothetical protein
MNKLFFITISILFSFNAYSQQLSTDIYVEIKHREVNDNVAFGGKTLIRQVIYLDSTFVYPDSLILTSENISNFSMFLQNYFFPSFQLSKNIKYNFDGRELVAFVPDSVKSFEIDFEFNTMFGLRSAVASFALWAYQYDWDSWFFTCNDMKINNAVLNIPDSTDVFVNLPNVQIGNKNSYLLNTSNLAGNDISFYILLQSSFSKYSFIQNKNQYNLYFAKEIVIQPDSTYSMFALPDSNVKRKIDFLKNILNKINNYFTFSDSCFISIADANLSYEKLAWGHTVECDSNKYFIIIDTSFWQNTSLAHELLHIFCNFNINKNDSSYYFFGESIIEYLANYFYFTKQERNSAFIKNYSNISNYTSIFKLSDNRMSADTGEGSSEVVYIKTPYKIYLLAQSIGEDKFVSLLSEFYKQAKKKNGCNFPDFEKFMKQNGVSDQQWNDFIKDL